MSRGKLIGIIVGVVCIVVVIIVVTTSLPAPEAGPDGETPQGESGGTIAFYTAESTHIIELDGTNERRLTDGWVFGWSPNGRKLVIVKESGVSLIGVDGTGETELGIGMSGPGSCLWSASGDELEKVLVVRWGGGRVDLNVLDVASGGTVTLVEGTVGSTYVLNAVFSPDGKRIAYMTHYSDPGFGWAGNLYVMNSDGTGEVELVHRLDVTMKPVPVSKWSPDGKKITWHDRWGLGVVNTDGTNKIVLSGYVTDFDWSPDGNRIAYIEEGDLYTAGPDGTGEVKVAEGVGSFSWSPDGKRFAVEMGGQINIMNADGSSSTTLVYGSYPIWSPG